MEIYLVRHAEAVEQAEGLEDETRWLSKKGRKVMKKAACRLRKMRVQPDRIITSPLTRAVQTAELLMAEVGAHAELSADSRLAPESNAEQLVELIKNHGKTGSIMLVGHEPLLSQTVALLLGRERVTGLGKGTCICLEPRLKPDKPLRFLWSAAASGSCVRSAKKALVPVE